jgi:non-ribosomal peptide synthetase component F
MMTNSDDWDFFSTFAGDVERSSPTAAPGYAIRDNTATSYLLQENFVAELSGQRSGCTRLGRYFERTCDQRPSATALECEGERESHADLDQRANRLATLLMARGALAGVRMGVLLHRSMSTYVALLAVTKTEATFVPIDPDAPPTGCSPSPTRGPDEPVLYADTDAPVMVREIRTGVHPHRATSC